MLAQLTHLPLQVKVVNSLRLELRRSSNSSSAIWETWVPCSTRMPRLAGIRLVAAPLQLGIATPSCICGGPGNMSTIFKWF